MYGYLWRHLPGPLPVKILIAVAIVVGIFFLLMEVVFPQLSDLMPYQEVAV
ncbi:hypothetical protein WG915_09355 [Corynebacterium sp. H128]|uniref:hypothetical protein n=1 Tax=Corynebacterium sp. H128 TaxID=3133427 RepID=UPI0030AA5E71